MASGHIIWHSGAQWGTGRISFVSLGVSEVAAVYCPKGAAPQMEAVRKLSAQAVNATDSAVSGYNAPEPWYQTKPR